MILRRCRSASATAAARSAISRFRIGRQGLRRLRIFHGRRTGRLRHLPDAGRRSGQCAARCAIPLQQRPGDECRHDCPRLGYSHAAVSLAAGGLFGFSWWSAETGAMDWHRFSGSVLLGLISFRIIWGLIGSNTARFATFLRSPIKVLAYLRSSAPDPRSAWPQPRRWLQRCGHAAAGAGADRHRPVRSRCRRDRIGPAFAPGRFRSGPLAAEIHEISFTVLQIVAAIHILAILFYLVVRKRNLARPMVTGVDPPDQRCARRTGPGLAAALRRQPGDAVAMGWWTAAGFPV